MSNMIRKSMPIAKDHISPLATGRIDHGYDNLLVRVLFYPEEKAFKHMVYKATMATRGSDITTTEYDEAIVEEAFSGGLNQCLEWATVVFEISGVSRGLTHELVRTRKASFAQQSMRHTDMGRASVRMPAAIAASSSDTRRTWINATEQAVKAYQNLTDRSDVPFQDARTVLPIATETYIIASYPLSEFLNTYSYRACYMFYPEIVALFGLMKQEIIKVCPWLEPYIKISCEKTRSVSSENEHMCTYQGWEKVEGHCPLPWAKEANRVWKSSKFEG